MKIYHAVLTGSNVTIILDDGKQYPFYGHKHVAAFKKTIDNKEKIPEWYGSLDKKDMVELSEDNLIFSDEPELETIDDYLKLLGISEEERTKAVISNLEKFLDYHEKNPAVYEHFIKYAKQADEVGVKFSIYSLRERVRWEMNVTVELVDDFKISNNHTPFYARLLKAQEPKLFEHIKVKKLFAGEGEVVEPKKAEANEKLKVFL